MLASNAVLFMSARRDIIRPRFSSHLIAHRIACLPRRLCPSILERLRLSALTTAGMRMLSCLSARLYQPVTPFRSFSPRPIDTENGENDGEGFVLVLGVVIRPAYPFNYVG